MNNTTFRQLIFLFFILSYNLVTGQTYSIKDTAIANAHFRQGDALLRNKQPASALPLLQKAMAIQEQVQRDSLPLAWTYSHIGNSYIELNQLDSAIDFHLKSLQIRKILFKNNELALTGPYINLAVIYDRKSDFDKAIAYTQKALLLFKQKPDELAFRIGQALNNLGSFYENKHSSLEAIPYFQQAIQYYYKVYKDSNHIEMSMPNLNLGMAYSHLKQLDSALFFIEKALVIRQEKLKRPNPDIAICLNAKAVVLLEMNRFEDALSLFQTALDYRKEHYREKHFEKAESYGNLGKLFLKKGEFQKAIEYSQKALNELNYLEPLDFTIVNNLAQLHIELRDLGNRYLAWFEATKDTTYLKKSAETFEEGLKAVQYTSNTFDTEGSKLVLKQSSFEMQEGILTCQIRLGQNFEEAFQQAELFKASLLREQINEIKGLQAAGVPVTIIQEDEKLKKQLTDFNRQLYELKSKGESDTAISVLNIYAKHFDIQQTHAQLKHHIEQNYPTYYHFKYDILPPAVSEIQKSILQPNQTLLEYFVGDSTIFIFVVNKDKYAVRAIPIDFALDSVVRSTLSGIYQYRLSNQRTDALKEQCDKNYTEGAYRLYEKLIAPIKDLLQPNVTIVPDGILNYLPFEVLLSQKPIKAYNYAKHKYLINDYTLSYAPSATILQEMMDRKHRQEPTKSWLGLAPFCNRDTTLDDDLFTFSDVEKRRSTIDTLPYAAREIANIKSLMAGESLFNEQATIETFRKTASQYRVIHLATHAKADDKAGNFSFLVFNNAKEPTKNELLYARDLYNMTLNSDMVVLSACETGIGQLQCGEGIIGLARAFTYAGAKSLITTLWRVNDESSQRLMIEFYKQLRKGNPKDEALRQAKQKLIYSSQYAAPFYWAPFISLGDMRPLKR